MFSLKQMHSPFLTAYRTTVLRERKNHTEPGGLRVTTHAWSYRHWRAALTGPVSGDRDNFNEKVDARCRRTIGSSTIDSLGSECGKKPDWNAASRESLFCFVSERELRKRILRLKTIESTSVEETSEFKFGGYY
jgi:hypothetical protein